MLRPGFTWIDPKELDFDLDKYSRYTLKSGVLEVGLEYPKELFELHSDYRLATDKIGIKRDMLFSYQTKIADFYISIGTIKKLVPMFLLKKSMYFIMKTCNFI